MNTINEVHDLKSHECLTDHVALFQGLPVLSSEEESYFVKLNPVTSISLDSPLLFEFDTPENFFADPSQIYLYLKSKIVDAEYRSIPKPDDDDEEGKKK